MMDITHYCVFTHKCYKRQLIVGASRLMLNDHAIWRSTDYRG